MRDFKFFRGCSNGGTLNMVDIRTYASASLHYPHHDQRIINRDAAAEQGERLHRDFNDNPIRLCQSTTVNPRWWMKIKIFFQETWLCDPIGVIVVTLLASTVTFIGIVKLFGL